MIRKKEIEVDKNTIDREIGLLVAAAAVEE